MATQTTRVVDVDSALVHLRVDYEQFMAFPVGKVLHSDVVSAGGLLWRIDIYPGGIRRYHERVSIYLRRLSKSTCVKAIFEPFFLQKDGSPSRIITDFASVCENHTCHNYNDFLFGIDELGYADFFPRSCMKDFLVDGHVTFLCSIVVVNEFGPVPVPPPDLRDHLGRLLEDDGATTSDVSFVVGGETFHAHRAVLVARSTVFASMLKATARSEPIALHEIAPSTFRALLRFMYTDAWPGVASDDDSSSVEMFQDLHVAAGQYALHRLKLMCARKLWDNVSVDTVSLKPRRGAGESPTVLTTTVTCTDSALVHFRVDYKQFMAFPVGKALHSDVVSIGGQLWRIDCYPGGTRKFCPRRVSIFLTHLTRSSSSTCAIKAVFEPFFLGKDGLPSHKITKDSHVHESNQRRNLRDKKFIVDGQAQGYREFFQRDALQKYVVDGHITFLCAIVVVNELGPVPVPASDLGDHLGRLLEDGSSSDGGGMTAMTDVSFIVDGEMFHAHRVVLAARSPVFKAQLFGSMLEATMKSTAPIALHEITPMKFRAMLRFMYTDAWPGDDEDVHDSSPVEVFQDLLAAADRYALDRLKLMCARKLWDNMSVDTVVTILFCAEMYNCPDLKKKCLDFFAGEDNLEKVASTDGYALVELRFLSIANEAKEKVITSKGK